MYTAVLCMYVYVYIFGHEDTWEWYNWCMCVVYMYKYFCMIFSRGIMCLCGKLYVCIMSICIYIYMYIHIYVHTSVWCMYMSHAMHTYTHTHSYPPPTRYKWMLFAVCIYFGMVYVYIRWYGVVWCHFTFSCMMSICIYTYVWYFSHFKWICIILRVNIIRYYV